jgi:hypothetical protein
MKVNATNDTTAAIVPTNMNGVRFPYFDLDLSDNAPKNGNINTARILSSDIIVPETVWGKPKWFVNIKGIIASYACQNAHIKKNAIPTSIVRL